MPLYGPVFGPSGLAGTADLIPSIHLRSLAGGGAKVIDIIGDSTATEAADAVDPTQTVWGAIKQELASQNPDCSFTFNNRAIGGSNWNHPDQTGTATGLSLPSWFTTPGNTWLSYVEADAPDVLFILLGTNQPEAGENAGNGVAVFFREVMDVIDDWTKIPDIVLITPKPANPAAGGTYLTNQQNHQAMAAFLRGVSRTNGAGYSFDNIPYFGLIDLGRHYTARVLGYDPAVQYLSEITDGAQSSLTLGNDEVSIGTTDNGDWKASLTFTAAGDGALYDAGGRFINIPAGPFFANRIRINLGSNGEWVPRYQLDGGASTEQMGSNTTPGAGDITVDITCKGETIQLALNGTTVLDVRGPRLTGGYQPTVAMTGTISGDWTFDVDEFYTGKGLETRKTTSAAIAYGISGSPTGGNGINHPSSAFNAVDWLAIKGANLAAPGANGAGAKNGSTVSAREDAGGFRTVLTLNETPITFADDAGTGQYGSVKIYDFPEGLINVVGAVIDADLTLTEAAWADAAEGDVGLGTTAVTDGDALATTEQNIVPTTAIAALSSQVGPIDAQTASAVGLLDGTSTAVDLYLNIRIDDDAAHAAGNGTVSGTVSILWSLVGDN